LSVIPGCEWG